MKKLIALLLALTLVVAFAGCEKKEETKVETVEALTALELPAGVEIEIKL